MYGLTVNHETWKTNDPKCHNTATYKASDDEKACRRPLQNPERPRPLSHLSQENCTMSVAAETLFRVFNYRFS